MKLKDFVDVAVYNSYWVGVYRSDYYNKVETLDEPLEEFKSTDKTMLKKYAECIVTGVWVLDEDTMAVSVMEGDNNES